MVMYDNELKNKEIKIEPQIKLNHNTNTELNFKATGRQKLLDYFG